MSVLVTGGAGYVGSAIMERLVSEGESVICLDNFSTGHREAICRGVEVVEASILDEASVSDALTRYSVDSVVHCAAFSIVEDSNRHPLEYFCNNVVGAHAVLSAMISQGVTRFVFSSTAAVYGDPHEIPIPEAHSMAPVSAYGRSKRMIEEMLEWHARAYSFKYVSLRYFNAAGATPSFGEDHEPETHLIPRVLEVARGSQPELRVYGNDYPTADGTCVRDYIHVEDLADAHVRAIRYLRGGGEPEALNLGAGSGHSVLEVIRAAEQATGRAIRHVVLDRRPGDSHTLVASRERAQKVLGWSPRKSSLDQIISDAWQWKQAHPDGYRS